MKTHLLRFAVGAVALSLVVLAGPLIFLGVGVYLVGWLILDAKSGDE